MFWNTFLKFLSPVKIPKVQVVHSSFNIGKLINGPYDGALLCCPTLYGQMLSPVNVVWNDSHCVVYCLDWSYLDESSIPRYTFYDYLENPGWVRFNAQPSTVSC